MQMDRVCWIGSIRTVLIDKDVKEKSTWANCTLVDNPRILYCLVHAERAVNRKFAGYAQDVKELAACIVLRWLTTKPRFALLYPIFPNGGPSSQSTGTSAVVGGQATNAEASQPSEIGIQTE